MGYKKAEKHTLTINFTDSTPVDSTTYNFMLDTGLAVPGTSAVSNWLIFDSPILITRFYLSTSSHAAYTDEGVVVSIRFGGADYFASTIVKDAVNGLRGVIDTAGSVIVPAFSVVICKMVTPAWATNPINFKGNGCIEYIKL